MSWFSVLNLVGWLKSGVETPVSGADPLPVSVVRSRAYQRITRSVSAPGDTLLATPSLGKRILLRRVYAVNDPAAVVTTKITIRLGDEDAYVVWAISQEQEILGPVNGALVMNLTNSGDVAVTIFFEEVDA